ncbi:MAG TPA: DUF1801 domain-containing protein [Chloroflexia bacterium]|nr:DUF1801 domain-containing protein [Chloroflexia bacterium]
MQSTAATVDEYLETVPPERLAALTRLRQLCLEKLQGYEESMQYGGPAYSKNGVVEISFISQKNYISFYVLKNVVVDRYRDQLKDVGKGCIRYRRPDQIDFAVVEKLLAETASSPA